MPPTVSPRPNFSRAKSILHPHKGASDPIPIPPSLLAKAPHLAHQPHQPNTPHISGGSYRDPRTPSRADEAWLGDTVPASGGGGGMGGGIQKSQSLPGGGLTVVRGGAPHSSHPPTPGLRSSNSAPPGRGW
ncbi:hypothetical protein FIBSPDRAFT_905279 [Athelia psychrophila]|uniref:Uncharacterized protein n=1 Tax=Athelia psychrophila TaxID=1759441 RepID=A0A167TMD1_9AGAM|nr:hypothetical protein FIBSPDRAFT_905279 [Fibularhizoctonia sp. CBS 109695]